MRHADKHCFHWALAGAALLATMALAQAQTSNDQDVDPASARQQAAEIARGDPPRWFREDATSAARLRTLQKEIGAALNEARNACRKLPKAERAACMKQARETWQQDMAAAREQAGNGTPR